MRGRGTVPSGLKLSPAALAPGFPSSPELRREIFMLGAGLCSVSGRDYCINGTTIPDPRVRVPSFIASLSSMGLPVKVLEDNPAMATRVLAVLQRARSRKRMLATRGRHIQLLGRIQVFYSRGHNSISH